MTTKGQASDADKLDTFESDARDSADAPNELNELNGLNVKEERASQAPSGVFRTDGVRRHKAGWTVAEQFVRGGFHYRLMRRPLESNARPTLTKREEDAVELACEGHSNKSIAQVLDVSPSTVGVLLFRAASKLNAKSRSELLSNYEQFKAAAAMAVAGSLDPD
jgi:DNA-binding CsgD family transcriptional regulator